MHAENPPVHTFGGNPGQIGAAHGRALAYQIRANLSVLVWREGYKPLPRHDDGFVDWVRRQEKVIGVNWPWLLDEIAAVAGEVDASEEDLLLLNLRAWQYEYYGAATPSSACSSLAVTLADGTVACAGALDDAPDYYCGPVKIVPDKGYECVTFPIAGTSWANRSMNSAGLAIGISSQLLRGLRPLPNAVNQDLAIRVMSQTCATVAEVREFCKAHPFTINIVAVDSNGGMFCAHQTSAGLLELPVSDGYCALTNHLVDDALLDVLRKQGATEFPECATTRPRLDNLLCFAGERSGKCCTEEVLRFIDSRDHEGVDSIRNKGTLCLTFANPEADDGAFRVMQTAGPTLDADFVSYKTRGDS